MEKEELLKTIEKLLSFDGNETVINPDYLQYFTLDELEKIRDELQKRYETMVEKNLDWLKSFKKE